MGIIFVGEQIALQHRGGVLTEQTARKTHPGVLPDAFLVIIEKGVQLLEQVGAEITAGGPGLEVGVGGGAHQGQGQVDVVAIPFNGHLKLVFHTGGGVLGAKGQLAVTKQQLAAKGFGQLGG